MRRSTVGIRSRFAGALTALALVALAAQVAAATPPEPIPIDDLVRMLDEGIPPDVVLAWLDARPGPVASPGPDDLIRLRRAGADDALLRRVVAGSPASAAAHAGGDAVVDVEIEYRPVGAWEGDERAEVGDLVLFVDGRLLARVAPQGDIGREPVRFRARVPAGPHRIRWGVEVDERDGAVLRGSPDSIVLETDPGAPRTLRFAWVESAFSPGLPDPLDWSVRRDGEPVAADEGPATPREDWTEICEDVEAVHGEIEHSRRARRRLDRCTPWAAWWPGVEELPTRSDARDATARTPGTVSVPRPFDPGPRP